MNSRWTAALLLLAHLGGCARPQELGKPQIYGGTQAPATAWPAVVAILVGGAHGGTPELRCSGALIAPDLVLTAGHCLKQTDDDVTADRSALHERLRVYMGPGREGGPLPSPLRVKSAAYHPQLRVHPLGYADVGLVELSEPVAGVQPLKLVTTLAGQAAALAKGQAWLVGYGQREDRGYGMKYEVAVPLRARTSNEAEIGGGGTDACSGDSGGPALTQMADASWQLLGTISRGLHIGCGNGGTIALAADASCWLDEASGHRLPAPSCRTFTSSYSDDELEHSDFLAMCDNLRSRARAGEGPTATQRETIAAVLLKLRAPDCASAAAVLTTASSLNLDFLMLRDLSPLAKLKNLKQLSLRGNWISDVSPLRLLSHLEELELTGNMLSSTAALTAMEERGLVILGKRAQLPNVRQTDFLAICRQQAPGAAGVSKTLRALFFKTMSEDCATANERLLAMRELNLPEQGLSDLTPLAGLSNLTSLDLSGNPLGDIAPLATLEHLRFLNLQATGTTDLHPLERLVKRGLKVTLTTPTSPN